MLSECLGMLFSRMERVPVFHIPWRDFTLMFLEGASTMVVSFKECERKLQLFPSIPSYHFYFFTLQIPLSLTFSDLSFLNHSQYVVKYLIFK